MRLKRQTKLPSPSNSGMEFDTKLYCTVRYKALEIDEPIKNLIQMAIEVAETIEESAERAFILNSICKEAGRC